MHISTFGAVKRSLYASYCGYRYAAYEEPGTGGLIVARADCRTLYFQPGDDAGHVLSELDRACDRAPEDDAPDAIDRVLDDYSVIEECWDSPAVSGCAPSSDLMLLNYYH